MLRSPKRGFAVPTMDQALSWMREFSVKHERTERQIPALEAQREKCRRKGAREWNGAIVAVGTGYGFVVQGAHDRFVITAAHCLPRLPSCNVGQHDGESLYPTLLGPPGGQQTVAAACYFAEPVSDIAVLGLPGGIESPEEFRQFLQLTHAATPLSIAEPPPASLGWIPSPDGDWLSYVIRSAWGRLLIIGLDEVHVEMSGVPIVSDQGMAFGVLCPDPERKLLRSSHPGLSGSLSGHWLRTLGVASASTAS